jgi:hypothetical protein
MSITTTPTAIDAYVPIERIWVVGRHRKDLGDIAALAGSIVAVGLINPVTLTPDHRLVAGQRRVEAYRRLGWDAIPARIVSNLDEAAALLRAERDENTCRKTMLPSELASLGEALYEIEEQNAKDRQGTRTDLGQQLRGDVSTMSEPGSEQNKTRHLVGEALGMSGRMYSDLRYVFKASTDPELPEGERVLAAAALDKMDRAGGVGRSGQEFRRLQRARRDAQEAKAAALAAPVTPDELDPVPPAVPEPAVAADLPPASRIGRTSAETADRFTRMRELAAAGHTSDQIAKILGYSTGRTVKVSAQEQGIDIPADAVMGRSRKKIDSNRIVRETVQTLESLDVGLGLIDFDELDRVEMRAWTDSLSESIRVLNRLNKRLKEKAQ